MLVSEFAGEINAILGAVELDVEEDEVRLFALQKIKRLLRGIGDSHHDKPSSPQGRLEITGGHPVVLDDQEAQAIGGQVVHGGKQRRGPVRARGRLHSNRHN